MYSVLRRIRLADRKLHKNVYTILSARRIELFVKCATVTYIFFNDVLLISSV